MVVEGIREKARVKFHTWLHQDTDSERERVCCVTGPLGSGKTTLAAEFCGVEPDGEGTRDVKKQKRESEEEDSLITAFYFFQGDDILALNKCWAKVGRQLAGRLGYDVRGDVSTEEEDGLVVFRRLVAEPLTRLSKPSNKVVVLVDGVDKLSWKEREIFWEIVLHTWERETPIWVHLAVFSYTTLRLSEAIRWIDLQDEDHEKDIELLCNARLASFMQDEEDVQYATKHIVKHSMERSTVLLYFSCVLDALLEGRSHRSVTLDDIWEMEWQPECLVHAFRPYLIRFFDNVMDGDMDRYQQLLSCLSAARTPLSIDVAAEALEMDNESFTTLLSRSTSLVYQECDAINFAHPCMKDVVQHRRCGKHPDGSSLHVDATRGHKWLANFLQASPTSPLALHDVFYHLCSSRWWSAVPKYLLDFDWVLACVSKEGCALALIDDADKLYNDKPFSDVCVTDVVRAIDLGLDAILVDSALLLQQIFGRIPDEMHPIRRSYEASLFARTERAKRVFLPISKTLQPARSSFRKRTRLDSRRDVSMRSDSQACFAETEGTWTWLDAKTHERRRLTTRGYKKWKWKGNLATDCSQRVFDLRFGKLVFQADLLRHYYKVVACNLSDTVLVEVVKYKSSDEEEEVEVEPFRGEMVRVWDFASSTCIWSELRDVSTPSEGIDVEGDIVFHAAQVREGRFCRYINNFRTGELLNRVEFNVSPRFSFPDGDGLGLLVHGELLCQLEEDVIKVWNWKSGQLEATLPSEARGIDLKTGVFTWKKAIREIKSGAVMGSFWSELCRYPAVLIDTGHFVVNDELHVLDASQPVQPVRLCHVRHIDDWGVLSTCELSATLWDLHSGVAVRVFDCSTFFPVGSRICNTSMSFEHVAFECRACVVVWKRDTGTVLMTHERTTTEKVQAIALYRDCLAVATSCVVLEFSIGSGNLLREFNLLQEATTSWNLSRFLSNRLAGIWKSFSKPHAERTWRLQRLLPNRLAVLHESFPSKISLFAYETGEVVEEIKEEGVHSLDVDGDLCRGDFRARRSSRGLTEMFSKVWNWRTGYVFWNEAKKPFQVISWSSDGELLLVGCNKSSFRLSIVLYTLDTTSSLHVPEFCAATEGFGGRVHRLAGDDFVVHGSEEDGLFLYRRRGSPKIGLSC